MLPVVTKISKESLDEVRGNRTLSTTKMDGSQRLSPNLQEKLKKKTRHIKSNVNYKRHFDAVLDA